VAQAATHVHKMTIKYTNTHKFCLTSLLFWSYSGLCQFPNRELRDNQQILKHWTPFMSPNQQHQITDVNSKHWTVNTTRQNQPLTPSFLIYEHVEQTLEGRGRLLHPLCQLSKASKRTGRVLIQRHLCNA